MDQTYPPPSKSNTPPRDFGLLVGAAVVPNLVVAYDDPPAVAQAMDALYFSDLPKRFSSFGACLEEDSANCQKDAECQRSVIIPHCLNTAAPWAVHPCAPAAGPGFGSDCARLATGVARAAESYTSLIRSMSGGTAKGGQLDPAVSAGLEMGLFEAWTLAKELNRRGPRSAATHAALALSGGSANGAFTAGYVDALLRVRDMGLATPVRSGIFANSRLSAVASTSVGSLVALPLDLYFTEPSDGSAELPANDAERAALAWCNPGAPPSSRPFQDCALHLLESVFMSSEWDLLCYEDGSVLDLVGSKPNVLRFSPLETDILTPILTGIHARILTNDLVREAMTVEYDQHILGTIDERACLLDPKLDPVDCIESPVMGSVVLPVFTHWIDHAYTGIHGGSYRDRGVWFDGGMRSETPAFRASAMTTGHILAINTGRAEGVPQADPSKGALDVVLRTMSEFVSQVQATELAMASIKRSSDQGDLATVATWLGAHPPPGLVGAYSIPEIPLTGTKAIFVPDYIKPDVLFADGYAFDPWITLGLFAWGQHMFVENAEEIFAWLQWDDLAKLVRAPGTDATFTASFNKYQSTINARWAHYNTVEQNKNFPTCYANHRANRHDLLDSCLRECDGYVQKYRGVPNSCDTGLAAAIQDIETCLKDGPPGE